MCTYTQSKSCPWTAFVDFLEYYINVYGGVGDVDDDDDCEYNLYSNKRKRERSCSETKLKLV